MFTEADYKKPLSEKLSEVIRRNAGKHEYALAATYKNVSISTIRDVILRANSLTEDNAPAIEFAARLAFRNATLTHDQAVQDQEYLSGEFCEISVLETLHQQIREFDPTV